MITESNFRNLLFSLGFSKSGEQYKKTFPHLESFMSVDFSRRKLCYPVSIKGGERNDGFDAPENFVVFECVNRLLEKGYRPEHIELEKEWHLGHNAKSGRADICVTGTDGSMLFIIECKTWGKQYDKAMSDTKQDGAQLFSYWQQEQSCKWLILYASDLKDGAIHYKAPTIGCLDDPNIIALAKKDKSVKLYQNAHTASEKHEAWKETYREQIHDDLIFSDDSVAYQIGVKPLLKKNLRDFTPDDKIVNRFEEILRHNNVSDKENAFNRLIALFICKLVDESTKDEDDEVEFQYKQGTDTYETLQDRLQRLHRDGMEKFMREEIYYISADYPEWLFSTYTGSKRKKAIEDLQKTIRILKFYSNNDFAFKDVHNEELFYQNGKILVEMVQLFEKYRIVYPSKHQFLGDLFEQLLNKGFKQNEGQFFTPMPITRFIWDSLPVDRMIRSERGIAYPKVIDYACGAGHFLTEAIEAINHFVHADGDNAWTRDHIFGIEKDYRLARVAKISLFMNGAGEGNIIFGDGLENAPDKGVDNEIFDVLVANPPYSVKDFKQHLQLKNNSFTLLDRIGSNGGEIETLFVERIGQLLKPRGMAAVILPSSILSNDSSSYTGAREQFLQNFYIRAIVAFGSKTFGATGTNTVVMFLEKFNEPPKRIDLAADSVDAIFSGEALKDWEDREILEAYIAQIEVDADQYNLFLHKDYSLEELSDIEYFKMYVTEFMEAADTKNLQKTKAYKNKSADEQTALYLERFYAYAHEVEREKLFYFSLVYRQTTVIITAPADNKAQKDFLGYDWSNRKGNEGIQIITPGGKLYDDSDRKAEGTLAHAIRQSFDGAIPPFSEEQKAWGSVVNTKDMLDFSRVSFNKAMRLSTEKKIHINTKLPVIFLDKVEGVEIRKGQAIKQDETIEGEYKVVAGGKNFAYTHNKYNRNQNVITISASGANAGYVNFWKEKIWASDCTTIQADDDILIKWIYYYLKSIQNQLIDILQKGAAQPHVYPKDIAQVPIPILDRDIQKQIVDECSKIDAEYETTRMSIEAYRQKIEDLFNEGIAKYPVSLLSQIVYINTETFDPGLEPETEFIYVDIDSVGKGTGKIDFEKKILGGNAPSRARRVAHKNSVILSTVRPNLRAFAFLESVKEKTIFSTGFAILDVIDEKKILPRYIYQLFQCSEMVMEQLIAKMGRGQYPSVNKNDIETLKIPVPPISVQQQLVDEAESIEKQIREAEKKLEALSGKTAAILHQYLN